MYKKNLCIINAIGVIMILIIFLNSESGDEE